MKFFWNVIFSLLIANCYVVSAAELPNRGCGSHMSDEEVDTFERSFTSEIEKATPVESANKPSSYIVLVYWHVIAAGKTYPQGYLTSHQIDNQIALLNARYKGTNLSFKLQKVTRTINSSYFNYLGPNSPYNLEVKKKLQVKGAAVLNVYSTGFKAGTDANLLGYATFPVNYAGNPINDGVVVGYDTLPGSVAVPYNLGLTLVHEVGHWLGLYHTFQGGCLGLGDRVSDTPPEASAAYGCNKGRDTCRKQPGLDPIHNYMDYSDDSCMTRFTAGQIARIKQQISIFRKINVL